MWDARQREWGAHRHWSVLQLAQLYLLHSIDCTELGCNCHAQGEEVSSRRAGLWHARPQRSAQLGGGMGSECLSWFVRCCGALFATPAGYGLAEQHNA